MRRGPARSSTPGFSAVGHQPTPAPVGAQGATPAPPRAGRCRRSGTGRQGGQGSSAPGPGRAGSMPVPVPGPCATGAGGIEAARPRGGMGAMGPRLLLAAGLLLAADTGSSAGERGTGVPSGEGRWGPRLTPGRGISGILTGSTGMRSGVVAPLEARCPLPRMSGVSSRYARCSPRDAR